MSILDVIGPVIIGPSSSHTAGAARIGNFARSIYHHDLGRVEINLYNSFAETGRGHGTDKAILGGILGLAIDDERLLKSYEIASKMGLQFKFNWLVDEDMEPDCAKIVFDPKGTPFSVTGVSVGGGEVEIRDINGYEVLFNGKYPVLIIIHQDVPGMVAFIGNVIADLNINIATMRIGRDPAKGEALAIINLDTEFPEKKVSQFYKNKHVKKVIRIEKLEE